MKSGGGAPTSMSTVDKLYDPVPARDLGVQVICDE